MHSLHNNISQSIYIWKTFYTFKNWIVIPTDLIWQVSHLNSIYNTEARNQMKRDCFLLNLMLFLHRLPTFSLVFQNLLFTQKWFFYHLKRDNRRFSTKIYFPFFTFTSYMSWLVNNVGMFVQIDNYIGHRYIKFHVCLSILTMSDCKVKSTGTNLNGSTGEEGSFLRKSHIVCPSPPMRLRRFCIHMITFISL